MSADSTAPLFRSPRSAGLRERRLERGVGDDEHGHVLVATEDEDAVEVVGR
jgi:hypothetical protein